MEYALTVDCPERIDIVLDIPYGLDDGNDVGGYTLLALAAKGNRIPIMSVKDMDNVVTLFQAEGGVGESYKKELINKVYFKIARHYFELIKREGGEKYLGCILKQELQLEGGENPYQRPAYLYSCDDADQLSLPSFKQISGNSPCYTNLADMDSSCNVCFYSFLFC